MKPENIVTMQTESKMKMKMKTKSGHIEEIMNDKEGERMGEELLKNAQDAAVGSLDKEKEKNEDDSNGSRASISAAMKSESAAPSE